MAIRRLGMLIVPAAGLTVFLAGYHSIVSEDFWWHVKVGGDILSGGGIPRIDTYSYPSAGRPYIDLHWLFQVLIHLVDSLRGEAGVIWMKCLTVTAAFAVIYRLARRAAPAPLAAGLSALGAILASERFLARPEIVSYLLLAITLWLLRRHAEGDGRARWLLPLVTLIWVNVEGLFVLGLIVIGAHLPGRIRDRGLWIAFGLSGLASLANPYFVAGAVHPLVLFSRINGALGVYSETIGEFLSPFAPGMPHPSVAIFPYYLALIGAALVLYARKPRIEEMILLVAFGYLAITARRNLALLGLVATPILARWIAEGLRRDSIARRWVRLPVWGRNGTAAAAAIAFLSLLALYDLALSSGVLYNASGTNRRFGTEAVRVGIPRSAARFLAENRVGGPLFNVLSAGGYLIGSYPEEKVFIDGRLEVHTTEHYADYLRILAGGTAWDRAEEKHGFRSMLLNYAEAVELTRERLQDASWEPVHLDETAIVLVKDVPENADLIERFRITRAGLIGRYPSWSERDGATLPEATRQTWIARLLRREPFPWENVYLGQFFGLIHLPQLAAGQYAEAVRTAPHLARPRILLATELIRMGERDRAVELLIGARRLCTTRAERSEVEKAIRRARSS